MRNLEPLSDYEFELLIADLLTAELGLRFEAFARGPDQGVDVRATTGDGRMVVAQCKHYLHSTFVSLESAARGERKKLNQLKPAPAEYYFATSRRLTVRQKSNLRTALNPWVTRDNRILGAADIELLLNRHTHVERSNVKLWLASGTALQAMLNAGTLNRTRMLLEQLREALPRYVENRAFSDAQKLLADTGVCLIAGEPGIGKTTLAQMLLLDSANAGYEPVVISEDVEEGWDLLDEAKPQIFYYDDFLGRTAMQGSLRKNEDARLVELMSRAARHKDRTRLILTTREYILREATDLYDTFRRARLDHRRFLLTLDAYTRLERALILYNHVHHSGQLTTEALRGLLNGRSYLELIDHDNFNPRLIEFITGLMGPRRLGEDELADWVTFARRALDNPREIWEHAFEQELTREQQTLLLVLLTFPGRAELEDLRRAFGAVAEAAGIALSRRAFETALRRLEVTFVATSRDAGRSFVSFANPSIEDFLTHVLGESVDDVRALITGAISFEQLRILWNLARTEPGRAEALESTLSALAEPFAIALGATVESDAITWAQIAGREGGLRLRRWPPSLEVRLQLLVAVYKQMPTTAPRLAGEIATRLDQVAARVRGRNADKRSTLALVSALNEADLDSARDKLLPVLTQWFVERIDTIDDYDLADDLRRAFPDAIPHRDWATLEDDFAGWAQDALRFGDLDEEDLDRLESVAGYYDVMLDEDELERARDRLAESHSGEDSVDEERLAEPDLDVTDAASDDDGAIDVLFARLSPT